MAGDVSPVAMFYYAPFPELVSDTFLFRYSDIQSTLSIYFVHTVSTVNTSNAVTAVTTVNIFKINNV